MKGKVVKEKWPNTGIAVIPLRPLGLTKWMYVIAISCMLFCFACTKLETMHTSRSTANSVEKFLAVPATAPQAVKRVAHNLQLLHEKHGFIYQIAEQEGYPVWDKAVHVSKFNKTTTAAKAASAASDTVVYIPLVRENASHVNAFIYARLNGDITMRLYDEVDYDNYAFGSLTDTTATAEKLAAQFMLLNYATFGHSDFTVLDNRLLHNNIQDTSITKNKTVHIEPDVPTANNAGRVNIGGDIVTYSVCTTTRYLVCTANHKCCSDGSCPGCQVECWHTQTVCEKLSVIVHYDDGGWGGPDLGGGSVPTDPGTGGPGTGTNPSTPTTCNPDPLLDNGLPPCPKKGTVGWEQSSFMDSRILELANKLSSNPYSLIPCDSLNIMPLDPDNGYGLMYQRIAQFQLPQYISNRIDSIKGVAPDAMVDNFNLQQLKNASGPIVNCDFFPVRIKKMPLGMSARDLTEYFRKHINDFVDSTIDVSFSPYKDGNFNDTSRFNSNFENSLGALVHIKMLNDGSVILSDYYIDTTAPNIKSRFKFSTLETPLDYEHPVAGNREFGVYESLSLPGEFTFYTMGVDRTWDILYAVGNWTGAGFKNADKLWESVQKNMINFINQKGGNAEYYSKKSITARPKWDAVKDYLMGTISFSELKNKLGCQ